MDGVKTAICAVLIFAGTVALIAPLLRYIVAGWRAKRQDIMDGLDAEARLCYFKMFVRNGVKPDLDSASRAFEQLYAQSYGRRFFLVPGLLLFLVGLLAVTAVVPTGLHRLGYIVNPLFNLPDTAMAAIAGAYLWVADDHISRTRRLDFAPSDVQWGILRIIIAVPMGYAFAVVTAPSLGPFIAFAAGAFPLSALTSMLRRLGEKYLNLGQTIDEAYDDIIKLQGVNKPIVERLAQEDITTVSQIAYCDPVRLSMRSHLSFNFIIDCMNQALAWMYFQDDLNTIRPLSIRGAVEIRNLIHACDDPSDPDHQRALDALPKIAAAVKQDSATLQLTLREIAADPYTIFLHSVWK